MPTNKEVRDRIRRFRLEVLHLGQKEMAAKLGINPATMNRIENGYRFPDHNTYTLLATKTVISMDWLLTGEGPMRRAHYEPDPIEWELIDETLRQLCGYANDYEVNPETAAKLLHEAYKILIEGNGHRFQHALKPRPALKISSIDGHPATIRDRFSLRKLARNCRQLSAVFARKCDRFVQKTLAKKRGAGRSRWYHIHVNSFSPGSGVLRPGFLLAAGIIVLGVLVAVRIRDDDTALRLGAMDAYCEAVSPGLCAELDRWATENNWPTWLCGPTSYALAVELDRRFFDGELPIVATPTGGDCIVIKLALLQTPLGGGQYHTGDHVWIEIHWRGLVMVVDPTITRTDGLRSICFAWFDENTDGEKRMALFKSLLRMKEPDDELVRLLAEPEKYRAEAAATRQALAAGRPPQAWLLWSAWLQRSVWTTASAR